MLSVGCRLGVLVLRPLALVLSGLRLCRMNAGAFLAIRGNGGQILGGVDLSQAVNLGLFGLNCTANGVDNDGRVQGACCRLGVAALSALSIGA